MGGGGQMKQLDCGVTWTCPDRCKDASRVRHLEDKSGVLLPSHRRSEPGRIPTDGSPSHFHTVTHTTLTLLRNATKKADFLRAVIFRFHLRTVNLPYKAFADWQIHLYNPKNHGPSTPWLWTTGELFVWNYIFRFPSLVECIRFSLTLLGNNYRGNVCPHVGCQLLDSVTSKFFVLSDFDSYES